MWTIAGGKIQSTSNHASMAVQVKESHWEIISCITLWYIWTARCKIVFEELQEPAEKHFNKYGGRPATHCKVNTRKLPEIRVQVSSGN
jgi:hypothetical protein